MNGLINLRTAIIWHSQVSCKSQSIISTDSISCSKDLVELWCSHTFDPSPTSGLYSPIRLPPPQKKKWRSDLSGCWQMHRNTFTTYFVNKRKTLSLYYKNFKNHTIVNKTKCNYWLNYKMVIASQRKTKQVNVNLSLTSIIWTLGRVFLTSLLGGKALHLLAKQTIFML